MKKFKLNDINYSFYNSEITVESKETQYEGDIIIPRFVVFEDKEYEVTQIGWYAFFRCKKLKRVVLPESIKHIGNRAFDGCDNLEKLIINTETPPSIDNYTFGKNKPKIMVPCTSIEAYTEHEIWKNFTINTRWKIASDPIESLQKMSLLMKLKNQLNVLKNGLKKKKQENLWLKKLKSFNIK